MSLFLVVLSRPFHAQNCSILFIGVGQFLHLFVEVAVVVAVVAVVYGVDNGNQLVLVT
jgi:hypothetical protein